jgi:hypothetical protein
MNGLIRTIIVIFLLLLIGGYVELTHCHYWVFSPQIDTADDFADKSLPCKLNSAPGLVGGALINTIKDKIGAI